MHLLVFGTIQEMVSFPGRFCDCNTSTYANNLFSFCCKFNVALIILGVLSDFGGIVAAGGVLCGAVCGFTFAGSDCGTTVDGALGVTIDGAAGATGAGVLGTAVDGAVGATVDGVLGTAAGGVLGAVTGALGVVVVVVSAKIGALKIAASATGTIMYFFTVFSRLN